jgi:hypothetical protein
MFCKTTYPTLSRSVCRSKSGQALLETFGIILLLCLFLFGAVQYVMLLTANEVIQYSADASVRARAVGMNEFMVYKVSRVATIPNAGRMTNPGGYFAGGGWRSNSVEQMWEWDPQPGERLGELWRPPHSSQTWFVERPRIPMFLESRSLGEMFGTLNYERWEDISRPMYTATSLESIEVTLQQDYPLNMPFANAFIRGGSATIERSSRLADHADYYLD